MGMIGNSLAQGLISGANIQDGTVDTPDIKDSAVTAAKIASAVVTPAKMDFSAGTANGVLFLNGSKVVSSGSALVFDGSNLGLGVTPSAGGATANYKLLEVGLGGGASLYAGQGQSLLCTNVAWSGGTANYKASSIAPLMYSQESGTHIWKYAGSGTAGNAISFTTAMVLTSAGRLGIGQTNPGETLHVSGSIRADNGSGTVTSLITTGGGSNFQVVHTSGDSVLSLLNSATAYGGFKLVGSTGSGMTLTGAEGILSAGNVPAYQTLGYFRFNLTKAQGTQIFCISSYPTVDEDSARFYSTNGSGASASATGMMVGKNSSTNRSINAAGTINASGADYAEYMLKCDDFVVAKGDVVGVDQDGKLTNAFADAVSFVVKSTDPSYVGGDTWFTEKQPVDEEMKDVVDGPIYDEWVDRREAARALVDRIAFAGQVPVNVTGATPGQYIVPVDDNGAIKGIAVSNPTFEQYQLAVGKVIAIEQDGRARIIVKVA